MLLIDQMIKADEEVFWKPRPLIVSLQCAPQTVGKSISSITAESISLSVTGPEWLKLSHKGMNNSHWLPAPLWSESLMNSLGGEVEGTYDNSRAPLTYLHINTNPGLQSELRDINFNLLKVWCVVNANLPGKHKAVWEIMRSLFSYINDENQHGSIIYQVFLQ